MLFDQAGLIGQTINQLTVLSKEPHGRYLCLCKCGKQCSVNARSLKRGTSQSCGCHNGGRGNRFKDLTGQKIGKLTVLRLADTGVGIWVCQCECGTEFNVLSSNMASMKKHNSGCRKCALTKDIRGEREGLLVAVSFVQVHDAPPLWTFQCDCGNVIQSTVREFTRGGIRSCGCHDNVLGSWRCMLKRCYDPNDGRYNSYGGRGIFVCDDWFKFFNFLADMGERPKKHTLSRKNAEEGYSKSNCVWEHVSKNCRDTGKSGNPTIPGVSKGAKYRDKESMVRAPLGTLKWAKNGKSAELVYVR